MSTSIIKKIKLGNTEQYLIVRGETSDKPVMLFLHGGPGIPELFTMKKEMERLEEKFVMVYWEQRGAGKSYKAKGLTLEQIVSDTIELSRMLIKTYAQDKIYLMGHSWGSFLGLLSVQKAPELYHAYMGIGQVTHQYEAERLSLAWLKEEAHKRSDLKTIKKLSQLTLPKPDAPIKEWSRFLNIHRGILMQYGGSVYDSKGVMKQWIIAFLTMQEYTWWEKIHFIPAAFYSMKQLWHDVVGINLFESIKKVEVPLYLFQGRYDYQVSYDLAEAFIAQVDAPEKKLFTFEHSAHSPHIEETDRFYMSMKEVEVKTNVYFLPILTTHHGR